MSPRERDYRRRFNGRLSATHSGRVKASWKLRQGWWKINNEKSLDARGPRRWTVPSEGGFHGSGPEEKNVIISERNLLLNQIGTERRRFTRVDPVNRLGDRKVAEKKSALQRTRDGSRVAWLLRTLQVLITEKRWLEELRLERGWRILEQAGVK